MTPTAPSSQPQQMSTFQEAKPSMTTPAASHHYIVIPGQVIASAPLDSSEFLRGHGTYVERDDTHEHLIASVVGRVQRVNKLIHVESVCANVYAGQVGDLVVGRIVAVAATRWKVQLTTSTTRPASLPLSGVHLPGGIQRVRTAQDARDMSQFLQVGDLVSAEVHKVQANDNSLLLHTRSLRYGKLENGCVVIVPPALVARRKNHYATLKGIFDVLWGCNGMIWIQRRLLADTAGADSSSSRMMIGQQELAEQQEQRRQAHADMPYSPEERQDLARLRNCIECLRLTHSMITDDAVEHIYDESIERNLQPTQMLIPVNVVALTEAVRLGRKR